MSKNKKNRDRDRNQDRNQNQSYNMKPAFPDSGENVYDETDYSEYAQESSESAGSEEESNGQSEEQQAEESLEESLEEPLVEINFADSVDVETSEPEEDFDERAYERAIRSIRLKIAGAAAIVLVSVGGFFGYRFYSSDDKAFTPYQPDELQRQWADPQPLYAENQGDWEVNDSSHVSVGPNDPSTATEFSEHAPSSHSSHSDPTNHSNNPNSESPIPNVPVLGLGASDQTSDSSASTHQTPAPRTSQSVHQPLGLGATLPEEATPNPVFASSYPREDELQEPQPTLVQISPKYSLDSQPTVATSTPHNNVGTDYSNSITSPTTTVPKTTVPTTTIPVSPGIPVPSHNIFPKTRQTPAFGSIGAEKGIKPFQPDSRSRSNDLTGTLMIESVQPLQKQPERSGERLYTVREGDNLFNIAKRELGSTSYWHEILRLNEDLLESNPDYLRPGLQLRLPDRASSVSETTNRGRSRQ